MIAPSGVIYDGRAMNDRFVLAMQILDMMMIVVGAMIVIYARTKVHGTTLVDVRRRNAMLATGEVMIVAGFLAVVGMEVLARHVQSALWAIPFDVAMIILGIIAYILEEKRLTGKFFPTHSSKS